jgi:N-methylhydantoinase A
MIKVGIDTGGTFTDFVFFDGKNLFTHKISSTPYDPSQAIIQGLIEVLGNEFGDTEIVHGTTVGTNALLERKGARVALVTTKGFEDVVQIGRQNRAKLYDLFWQPREPLVPKMLRFGVNERADYEGRILKRLKIDEVERLCYKLKKLGVECIAISFLHSYKNSKNEVDAEKILSRLGIPISTSSRILPEFREYERTSTIVANSYLQPKVRAYMKSLSDNLPESRVLVMQSSGGVIFPKQAGEEPVRIIYSGPAGGVVGGFKISEKMGYKRVITYDMGGTSTDIALCDGSLLFTTENKIDGIPITMPMLDVITIGAGGGSIAYVDSGGVLKVGPESAGADPGPACYGRGSFPTVTDANVVLGRINPKWFLGGKMEIFPEKSRSALRGLANRLNTSVLRLADGIIKVSNSNMERALRVASIGRGYDPRDFALFSFGGAGGLHACELAVGLGIKKVIFPKDPGVFSALGMLMAESFKDYSQTIFLSGKEIDLDSIEKGFDALEKKAGDDFPFAELKFDRFMDARYKRQSHEITIPFSDSFTKVFHRTHKKKYGYEKSHDEIEIVTLRLRAVLRSKGGIKLPFLNNPKRKIMSDKNKLFFNNKRLDVKSYVRDDFYSGFTFKGPALVLENTSTIFIPPTFWCSVDRFGYIIATV